MSVDASFFWSRFKLLLKEQHKTQLDVCSKTGINVQTLRNKISRNILPSTDEVVLFSDFFNVSCDYLLLGKEFEEAKKEIEEETKKMEFNREQILASFNTLLDCIENNLKIVENDKK